MSSKFDKLSKIDVLDLFLISISKQLECVLKAKKSLTVKSNVNDYDYRMALGNLLVNNQNQKEMVENLLYEQLI